MLSMCNWRFDSIDPAQPEPLFPVRPPGGVADVTMLAITRDGSRIYLPQPIEQIDSDVIHIRTGWATQ